MPWLTRALLAYALALAVFLLVPPFLKDSFPPYDVLTWQDAEWGQEVESLLPGQDVGRGERILEEGRNEQEDGEREGIGEQCAGEPGHRTSLVVRSGARVVGRL